MYYAAYGSNLDKESMRGMCKSAKPLDEIDYLHGYRLVFKGSEDGLSYLTIEEADGMMVPIGLYRITNKKDFKKLDRYEAYPELYSKYIFQNQLNGEDTIIYIMNPEFDYYLPSIEYYDTCLSGYKDFNIDPIHLETALEYTETIKKIKKKVL